MDEDTITNESEPIEGEELAVSETTDETVEQETEQQPTVSEAEALTLDELNKALGKNFKTKDGALKSLKDTNKYVGEKKATADKATVEELNTVREKLEVISKDNFYTKNPQYKTYESLIEKLGNREEVVKSKDFKDIFDKLSSAEEPTKSVIHSNSRIAESTSEYSKDFENAQKTGDWSDFIAKHKGVKAFEE